MTWGRPASPEDIDQYGKTCPPFPKKKNTSTMTRGEYESPNQGRLKHGMEVQRAESLNDSPVFIRALADLAASHLKDYSSGKAGPTSLQLGLRCPGCNNATCGAQKAWFARAGR